MKLEHIGIAVKSLSDSEKVFAQLLNTPPYKTEEVASEKVKTLFFQTENAKIELLEATQADSVISQFIDKRSEGLHHIAFEVKNIREEMKRLADLGFKLLQTEPKKGADGKWVCFVHPKDAHGVLWELCEQISDDK